MDGARTQCPHCNLLYLTTEPTCPRCRQIRQTNMLIVTTLIMLVILVAVGWIGMQFFM